MATAPETTTTPAAQEDTGPQLYRFRVRTSDGAEMISAVAVVDPSGKSDAADKANDEKTDKSTGDELAKGQALLYRFIVKTSDGREMTSSLAVVESKPAK